MPPAPEQSPAGTDIPEVLHETETSSGTEKGSGTDFAWAEIGAEMVPPPHGIEEPAPTPFPGLSSLSQPLGRRRGMQLMQFGPGDPLEMRFCPQPCSGTPGSHSCVPAQLHEEKPKGSWSPAVQAGRLNLSF